MAQVDALLHEIMRQIPVARIHGEVHQRTAVAVESVHRRPGTNHQNQHIVRDILRTEPPAQEVVVRAYEIGHRRQQRAVAQVNVEVGPGDEGAEQLLGIPTLLLLMRGQIVEHQIDGRLATIRIFHALRRGDGVLACSDCHPAGKGLLDGGVEGCLAVGAFQRVEALCLGEKGCQAQNGYQGFSHHIS